MNEYTVEIDSTVGAASSEDQLLAFADALHDDQRALGSVASMNTETGMLSATFAVEATDVEASLAIAFDVFNAAVASAAAGVGVGGVNVAAAA